MSTETEPFNVSAYGGEGWSPRLQTHTQEIGTLWGQCGINTESSPLKAVLLHRPGKELFELTDHNAVQMLEPIDPELVIDQHNGIADSYRNAGVTVHYVDPAETPSPNQMFCADLMFMTPAGVILARPASTIRAGEERWVARRLADLGIPIYRTLQGTATFEGADAMWINSDTVILGRGLRTNDEGARQVTAALNDIGVEVIQVDLPFGSMHLMGMLRFADKDLALAWPKRFVHRGVDALKARGYRVEYLPTEREAAKGSAFNFVTLGPREILMSAGMPQTQAFFESLGIKCHTTPVHELRKAAGAIGCLTGVVEREM
ncbi:MAG: arginine deiminase family protein [Chloroflexota bacterium]